MKLCLENGCIDSKKKGIVSGMLSLEVNRGRLQTVGIPRLCIKVQAKSVERHIARHYLFFGLLQFCGG